MSLHAIQRALAEVCYASEPTTEAFDSLHDAPARWSVYRHMVRTRLEQMARKALRRTVSTVGTERFAETFAAYLAEQPPRTRYIREVVTQFAAFAQPRWREAASLPPHAVDLLRFEAARWELADRATSPPSSLADFDFDAVPVLGSAHEVLRLEYPVHRKQPADQPYAPAPCRLLLYRRPEGRQVEVMSLNEITAALLERWVRGSQTVSDSVKEVAAARGIAVDAPFVEGLCEVLAELLSRGVILGSRV